MLKDLIEKEGITLTRDGRYLVGISPFSDSRLPMLYVDEKNETFTDMSTGINGDAVCFIENLKGVSRETAERLINKEIRKDSPDNSILKKICLKTNQYFRKNIESSEEAVNYLKERGFDEEDIRKYEFGYAGGYGNSLYEYLRKDFKEEDILMSGVCKHDKYGKVIDLLWERVTIPIRDTQGDIVAFGGRVIGEGNPKYINSPESPIFHKREMLFGYSVAKNIKCNSYILCEGYMDTIALHKAGLTNAVASLGTALSRSQCELLADKGKVYVLYDTDAAGVSATVKAVPMLEKMGIKTRVIDYSPAKDPDEFIRRFGIKKLGERFKISEDGESYVVKRLIENDIDKTVKYLTSMSVKKILSLVNKRFSYPEGTVSGGTKCAI